MGNYILLLLARRRQFEFKQLVKVSMKKIINRDKRWT